MEESGDEWDADAQARRRLPAPELCSVCYQQRVSSDLLRAWWLTGWRADAAGLSQVKDVAVATLRELHDCARRSPRRWPVLVATPPVPCAVQCDAHVICSACRCLHLSTDMSLAGADASSQAQKLFGVQVTMSPPGLVQDNSTVFEVRISHSGTSTLSQRSVAHHTSHAGLAGGQVHCHAAP